MPDLDPTLHELADAYRIATEYWDWQGRHVSVTRDTIVAVLGCARCGRLDARSGGRGPR